MKKFLTLILMFLSIGSRAQTPSKELLKAMTFNGLENKVKQGYGTKADPIPSGAFKYISERPKMHNQMLKLKNSYRWPNGEKIDFSKRFSTRNEAGTGIVDCYSLIKPGTTDTIFLFVDPYKEEMAYFVPEGLTAVTLPVIKDELQPLVKQIDENKIATDVFPSKEITMELLGYMYNHFGVSLFMDPDKLSAVVADKEADKELTSNLLRYYMISKFYAYAKDIKDPKQYAFDQMKIAFQKYIQLHPEVKIGDLNLAFQ